MSSRRHGGRVTPATVKGRSGRDGGRLARGIRAGGWRPDSPRRRTRGRNSQKEAAPSLQAVFNITELRSTLSTYLRRHGRKLTLHCLSVGVPRETSFLARCLRMVKGTSRHSIGHWGNRGLRPISPPGLQAAHTPTRTPSSRSCVCLCGLCSCALPVFLQRLPAGCPPSSSLPSRRPFLTLSHSFHTEPRRAHRP